MNAELKSLLFSLLWRILAAGALLLGGTAILLSVGPAGALFGFGLFLVAAILLAHPCAQLLASAFDGFLWSKSYYNRPQPMYGIPRSRRVKGLPEEAIAEYEKIAAAFPDETRPWHEMLAIAIEDLKDPNRAQAIFARGIAFLKKPDDRDRLAKTYAELLAGLVVRPARPPLRLRR